MCYRGHVTDARPMHPRDLAPFAMLLIPIASFAAIVASAAITDRTPRVLLAIVGWVVWGLSVIAMGFVGLLVVGLGCWGDMNGDCGETASLAILVGGVFALGLPAAVHQVVARLSSRDTPSGPRPPR